MSYEVWGDNDDANYDHLLEAGWWDDQQVDAVKAAVSALFSQQIYEGGTKELGISVQFIMRMTLLKVAVGQLPDNDPMAVEAKNYFGNPALAPVKLPESEDVG